MLQQTILDFLTLRQSRQQTFFSQSQSLNANFNNTFIYDGLNGLLIEGEPGIGKSQLVIKTLKANLGTSKIYHISASSTPEEKQTQLRAAFHHGDIAVVDEINCACLDERFLNAILSGIDPITHQRPITPGFLLIGTMNPATMSGRQSFGEALSRRFLKIILEPYSQNEMVDILTHKGLDEQGSQYMVSLYLYKKINATLKFNPALCFRDLIHVANECLPTTTFGYKAHAKSGMCFYSLPDEEEKQTQEAVLKVTF